MLELRNVDAVYNGVIQVLRGVSLEVRPGQIVTFLGSNGAGKTTTLKAISSLLSVEQGRVEQGEIRYEGELITNVEPAQIIRAGIVQVLEGRKILKHLNVEQNLLVGAHLRSDKAQIAEDIAETYASFPSLQRMRQRAAGYLSGGEMQMLLVGRALMARPRLLLLDEPAMGLAPLIIKDLFDFLLSLRDRKGPVDLHRRAERAGGAADRRLRLRDGERPDRAARAEGRARAQRRRARVLPGTQPLARATQLSRRQALQAAQALARIKGRQAS